MEILSVGEKIKRLRLEIGLKQDDLTDNQITRSLISMIENGKRSLSMDSAIIIATKLNHHYKNLDRHISTEYLMESEKQQASKYILQQFDLLNSIVNDPTAFDQEYINRTFDYLIGLSMEWSLSDELSDLLIVRGNLHQKLFKYNESIEDYSNSLEHYISVKNYDKIARLYGLIGNCYIKQFFVEQALLYYNRAYTTALEKKIPSIENAKKYSLFNIVLCYKKLKKYDLALQTVKSFHNLKNVEEDIVDQMTMLEASIYCEMNNFDRSYKLYQHLLSKEATLNSNTLGLTYNNIAALYRKMGDINTAFFYISKALELKDIIEEKYVSNFLLLSAKCHKDLNETDLAIDLLHKAYDISIRYKYYEVMLDSVICLSEIYLNDKNLEEAEKQLSYLKNFVEENQIFSKYATVYALLAEYYLILGDKTQCIEYLDKIREISIYF